MTSRAKVMRARSAARAILALVGAVLLSAGIVSRVLLRRLRAPPRDRGDTANDYLACGQHAEVSPDRQRCRTSRRSSGEQVHERRDHHQGRPGSQGPAARLGDRDRHRAAGVDAAQPADLGARNDHDSLGLFQQRPSMGWGTPAQVVDPVVRHRKVLRQAGHDRRLADHAADPGRAATCSAAPIRTRTRSTSRSPPRSSTAGRRRRASRRIAGRPAVREPGQIAASGWTVPLVARISSGFRTPIAPDPQRHRPRGRRRARRSTRPPPAS